MKLHQLRYLAEVAKSGLNLSAAAEVLHTSQPGLSKQLRLLEQELGSDIFVRNGKRFVALTEAGAAILASAQRVLQETENLRQIGREFSDPDTGELRIATTHTQARYVLPPVLLAFAQRHPRVRLSLFQGNPRQVAAEVAAGRADLAIATEAVEQFPDLVTFPCYQWNRVVVVPPGHALLALPRLTLEALAQHPLVTYDEAFTGRSKIDLAFHARGLTPNVVMTAVDSDVIKTYSELGIGVGIIARMAFEPEKDTGLRAIDASSLFQSSTTRLGIRRGTFLRRYMYDFVKSFAPHLDPRTVELGMTGQGGDYAL